MPKMKKSYQPVLRNQAFKLKVNARRTTDKSALEKLRCHSTDGAKSYQFLRNIALISKVDDDDGRRRQANRH